MSTRSGRVRPSVIEASPPRVTKKGVSPPRSPARNRKSSPPARSPSRKSPSRRSPSRKSASKFPARKSPSRSTKETNDKSPLKSPKKEKLKTEIEQKLADVTSKIELLRNARPRRSEYSIKDLSDNHLEISSKNNGLDAVYDTKDTFALRNRKLIEEIAPRRSTRLRDYTNNLPDRRSFSNSISKSVSQSLDTFSDEDNSEVELKSKSKSKSTTRKLATPLRETANKLFSSKWEFGGRIGTALLLILLPLTVFAVLLSCVITCSAKFVPNVSSYLSLSIWLNALAIISGQIVLQAIFALIPVCGPKVDKLDDSGKNYCFNAFFSSIITLFILFLLDYLKLFNSNSLLADFVPLAFTSYVFAAILSVILYVKSRNINYSDLNPYGNTGYIFYDFCVGREIHPSFKKLNIKIWISRICNITALILAILAFKNGFHIQEKEIPNLSVENYKELIGKITLKPTILVFSLMQIIYILNCIVKEYKITTTFFWQSEGLGYLQLVSSALYPFYFTTVSKFIVDSGLKLSTNTLIAASVVYFTGFIIMTISNNIKYEFRKNPLHPNLTNLETMPTFHGKKLLLSNLWGILRHPNYSGDIIVHIVLALPGILSQTYVASVPSIMTILLLLHRAWRDDARCKRKYGAAWQRYSKKVPSVILPKIL